MFGHVRPDHSDLGRSESHCRQVAGVWRQAGRMWWQAAGSLPDAAACPDLRHDGAFHVLVIKDGCHDGGEPTA